MVFIILLVLSKGSHNMIQRHPCSGRVELPGLLDEVVALHLEHLEAVVVGDRLDPPAAVELLGLSAHPGRGHGSL